MQLSGDFRVINVKETGYRGVVRLDMEGDSGVSLGLEYPRDAVGVDIKQGSNVKVSISNDKDPNYASNWDVYMNGVVYYVGGNSVKISIGGLIMDINNFKNDARVGEKVYVGLKVIK
ncbi:hypothetical protein [Vulcanisaeta souniana]|uniref:Uncharacterized protein n=1 Tax=Vulcanisaeta souniana JCM 11219 TaxID=1293586 RepID=A0A830EIY6_9CREN|nr:hypothetical protein [Vulcanisaeta souniana]BDR91172.1 hypothetical protein Vsou_02650 [Vulcanisaeta souniana JCM 11219]GGI81454.1 hypothetical protein GCM10007112_17690 [Vulcanisaeta souniana JCM 11219]